jgi:hypothetical protein
MIDETLTVSNWDVLLTAFGAADIGGTSAGYVYRGQSNSSQSLEPSVIVNYVEIRSG